MMGCSLLELPAKYVNLLSQAIGCKPGERSLHTQIKENGGVGDDQGSKVCDASMIGLPPLRTHNLSLRAPLYMLGNPGFSAFALARDLASLHPSRHPGPLPRA